MNTSILNKVKNTLIHLLVLSLLVLPVVTLAADDPNPNDFIVCGYSGDDCEFSDFFILASLLMDKLIFMIAIPLTALALMIGGVMYALYPTNPGNKATAWKIIKAAIIGLVITIIAYALVKMLIGLVINEGTFNLNSLFPA